VTSLLQAVIFYFIDKQIIPAKASGGVRQYNPKKNLVRAALSGIFLYSYVGEKKHWRTVLCTAKQLLKKLAEGFE